MRLLQVSPAGFNEASTIGGGERYVDNLCKAVRLVGGADVSCVMLTCGGASSVADPQRLVMRGDPDFWDSLDIPVLTAALAQADVVHVHQCLTGFGLLVAAHARLAGKVVIGTDHGGGDSRFLFDHPHLLRLYARFQTYGDLGAASFLDFGRPVTCIRGPVDDAAFTPAKFERDPGLLLAVGRLLPHKGFETIIDALPAGLRLVIAGRRYDEAYWAFLQARAAGKRVRFATGLDDRGLLAVMRQAGLLVHASTARDYLGRSSVKAELLGLAPLEAMCTGLPALVTDTGALRELSRTPGCRVIAGHQMGAALAEQRAHPAAAGEEIRAGVVETYGLAQFGRRYLEMVSSCVSC